MQSELERDQPFASVVARDDKFRRSDPDVICRLILAGGEVERFHDPARPYSHPEDVDIALNVDRYDFAIRVEFENGRPVARMEKLA
jgi:2-phosphosulfolactate phosphatase